MISRSRGQKRHSWKTILGSILSVVLFLAIFGFCVYFFRSSQKNDLEKKEEQRQAENPATPAPASFQGTEASLVDLKSGTTAGIAMRQLVGNIFMHTIKAQLLTIDPTLAYEGWLVRSVPYHFFSTGEMVRNKEGQYVLEWKGDPDADYSGYTKVVVTLEARDGNSDPSEHILEGVFGQ